MVNTLELWQRFFCQLSHHLHRKRHVPDPLFLGPHLCVQLFNGRAWHLYSPPLDKYLRPERLWALFWLSSNPHLFGHPVMLVWWPMNVAFCVLRSGCRYCFERQICIVKHLRNIFLKPKEKCASPEVEGSWGRVRERRRERRTRTYAFQLPQPALKQPHSCGRGGSARCSADLRDLCPARWTHIDDSPRHSFEKVIMGLTWRNILHEIAERFLGTKP